MPFPAPKSMPADTVNKIPARFFQTAFRAGGLKQKGRLKTKND